jgi:hypothetical protein
LSEGIGLSEGIALSEADLRRFSATGEAVVDGEP